MPKLKSRTNRKAPAASREPRHLEKQFAVVAIGASAGGIEAVTDLVRFLPADTGMAFVIVQHLDPKHHSILTDLISKQTEMQVVEVQNGMKVEANRTSLRRVASSWNRQPAAPGASRRDES